MLQVDQFLSHQRNSLQLQHHQLKQNILLQQILQRRQYSFIHYSKSQIIHRQQPQSSIQTIRNILHQLTIQFLTLMLNTLIFGITLYMIMSSKKRLNFIIVKIVDNGLYFIFLLFYFSCFLFFFFFYFQNNSGQGLSVTLSHQSQIDGVVTRLITRLGRRKQKVLEQSDVIQHGQHMLASCNTHGTLGQGAQQLARTMSTSI